MPCEIGRNEDRSGRSYRKFERRNTLQIPRSIRERQEDNLALDSAAKVYQQRLSVIWSSPSSDYSKVLATNLFADPVLTYIPNVDADLADRRITKIGQSFKETL